MAPLARSQETFGIRIHKNSKQSTLNELVIRFSLKNPHLGEDQVAKHLNRRKGIDISRSTVRQIWLLNNLETIALRQL